MDQALNQYEDIDYEPDYGTLTEELCRECKEGYYIKCTASNGPDDYMFTWTCNSCGAVESN